MKRSKEGAWRTAVERVYLSGADYRRGHEASHAAAGAWNLAVDWTYSQWREGKHPSQYETRAFLTSLPLDMRPLHAHTTEEIAHDLWDAIATYRKNRAQGMDVKPPWRHKNYRPLSFSAGYGWRVSDNRGKFEGPHLSLSLGRGRPPIWLALPKVVDSSTGLLVGPDGWGEIHLCWDRDARAWALHVAYRVAVAPSPGGHRRPRSP